MNDGCIMKGWWYFVYGGGESWGNVMGVCCWTLRLYTPRVESRAYTVKIARGKGALDGDEFIFVSVLASVASLPHFLSQCNGEEARDN